MATDASEVAAVPAKKRNGRPPGAEHPKTKRARQNAEILELAAKDVNPQAIARATGLPVSTVRFHVKKHRKYLEAVGQVDAFRDGRARILTGVELTLLQSMMEDRKLAKASVNNLAYAYRQVHDSRRLEEGLSTANTSSTVRFTRVDVADRTVTSE